MKKCFALLLLLTAFGGMAVPQGGRATRKLEHEDKAQDFPIVSTDKLTLAISSDKQSYNGIDAIRLDVTLKNTGEGKVRLFMEAAERFYDIEVTGPLGTKVPLLASMSDGILRRDGSTEPFGLRNNQTKTATIWINRVFDMSIPGTYKVSVSKKLRLIDSKRFFTISSNSLNLQVSELPPMSVWH